MAAGGTTASGAESSPLGRLLTGAGARLQDLAGVLHMRKRTHQDLRGAVVVGVGGGGVRNAGSGGYKYEWESGCGAHFSLCVSQAHQRLCYTPPPKPFSSLFLLSQTPKPL